MPAIWKQPTTVEELNKRNENTAVSALGIEFTEIGDDYIKARMPVDSRTFQPSRLLHGGASVLLAETLGSSAAGFAVPPGFKVVGLDINANHVRGARGGWVYGITRPIHIGRTTHVWAIDITNEEGKTVCVSRITMAVLTPNDKPSQA